MTENEPKQVIIDYLCRPLGVVEPSHPSPVTGENTWRGVTHRGGGLGAKAATVQFLKGHS